MPLPDQEVRDLAKVFGDDPTLARIGAEILSGQARAIRYREKGGGGKSMVFVAKHDDVVEVLKNEHDFSLEHYVALNAAMSGPRSYLVMRPEGPERAERLAILQAARDRTDWFGTDPAPRHAVARRCVNEVLGAFGNGGRIDLIGEYGFFVPYLISERVLGVQPPKAFSLLSLGYLINGHSLFQIFRPEFRPYLNDVAWSQFATAQLMGDFENRNVLFRWLGRYGAKRLRTQFEEIVQDSGPTAPDQTLLNALWSIRSQFPKLTFDEYQEHVISIMVELTGTMLLTLGLAFTRILKRWTGSNGPGFHKSLSRLQQMDAEKFVQEECRLAPAGAKLLRTARRAVHLGGLDIEEGEYVCALLESAGRDVPKPEEIDAHRPIETYVHFGPSDGPHHCFARHLTPAILAEMFLGLATLDDLTLRGGVTHRFNVNPGRLIATFKPAMRGV